MRITNRHIGTLLTCCLLVLGALPVRAQPADYEIQPLADIGQTAVDYALNLLDSSSYANISATSQAMDERLRLKKCEFPLEASVNSNLVKPGRISVGIRCTGSSPWSLYVPVMISATTQVVVVKGPLQRGTLLQLDNLEVKDVPVEQLPPNYISNINDVVGMELNRFINNEAYATAQMMKVRNLVQKGQEVVIVARNNSLEVRMAGVALEPGQQGDRISVKNSASGRTVEGRITESGTIIVNI